MHKISFINDQKEELPCLYTDLFYYEKMSIGQRLVIGPRKRHISLLLQMAAIWKTHEYIVFYICLKSQAGYKTGRYHSPTITDYKDLQVFLSTFQECFESDGFNNIWVGLPQKKGLLVYDRHNVIFAYGDLYPYEKVLLSNGFKEKEFKIPEAHKHDGPSNTKDTEDMLMAYFNWKYFSQEEVLEY